MVPKNLTEEQKQRRITIYQGLLERQDYILGRVNTGDEICVYQYDPETKRRSAQCKTQFVTTKKISVGLNHESKNVTDFFILEGLFIMNLYQMDKQSTKFTI